MTQGPAISRRVILDIFILSGAAGLIYEVVWARQLVLVFGNTTQAVSAILTGFFGGMAIGSAVGGRYADRVRRPVRMYGILELVLVVVVILTPITFRLLHEVYRGAFNSLEANPSALALVRFALAGKRRSVCAPSHRHGRAKSRPPTSWGAERVPRERRLPLPWRRLLPESSPTARRP